MFGFFTRSLTRRLALFFLSGAVFTIFFTSLLSFFLSQKALEKEVYSHLISVTEIRKKDILRFLGERISDMKILAESADIKNAFRLLQEYHDTGGELPDGSYDISSGIYKDIYKKIDPFFRKYTEGYGYDDLLLLCKPHGHVMYSAARRADMGTALKSGQYKDSNLAWLWAAAVREKKTLIADFSIYAPAAGPAAFIGAPMLDENENVFAVLALQISAEKLNAAVQDYAGMGDTGETILVGPDLLMRTNSRFEKDSSILKKKVDTIPVHNALEHKRGSEIITDYRGMEVLASYSDVGLAEKFGTGFEWAIVSKIDTHEAFAPVQDLLCHTVEMGLVLALLACIGGYFAARSVSRPLRRLSEKVIRIRDGDLTPDLTPITRADEVGILWNSFGQMAASLQKQIQEIREGANILASSVAEISASVSQLASSAAESAAAVNETGTTVEEVRQTALISSQKAKTVSEMSQIAARTSQSGMEVTENAIKGMARIKEQMRFIADSTISLSEQSRTIGDIIDTVADIAEQSNLLAVNAAIEAVKAGEQGKGFGVVAQEIRRLADQSRQATIRVRTILNDIQKAVSTTVMATEQGEKAVDSGEALSTRAGDAIREMARNITESAQAAAQIAASGQQQMVGVDQVAEAMESIRTASAQNLEGSRQLEAAAMNLNQLGQRLRELIAQYRV